MRAAQCEDDLNRYLRGKEESVSVYTVMLIELAFPLFKQVGIKLNKSTLVKVLFVLALMFSLSQSSFIRVIIGANECYSNNIPFEQSGLIQCELFVFYNPTLSTHKITGKHQTGQL